MGKQLQRCSFEQSIKLGELGFDWITNCFYTPTGLIKSDYIGFNFNECNDDINVGSYRCSAPTIQHALMWLRDEKNIDCAVNMGVREVAGKYVGVFYYGIALIEGEIISTKNYESNYDAEKELLNELIKP